MTHSSAESSLTCTVDGTRVWQLIVLLWWTYLIAFSPVSRQTRKRSTEANPLHRSAVWIWSPNMIPHNHSASTRQTILHQNVSKLQQNVSNFLQAIILYINIRASHSAPVGSFNNKLRRHYHSVPCIYHRCPSALKACTHLMLVSKHSLKAGKYRHVQSVGNTFKAN